MKLALLATLVLVAGAAHANKQMVTIEGDAAKKLFLQLQEDPSTELLENTTGMTIIANHEVTCMLRGNHAASAAALGGEQWSCELPVELAGHLK